MQKALEALKPIRNRYTQLALAQEEFNQSSIVAAIKQTLQYVKQSISGVASSINLDNKPQKDLTLKNWSNSDIHSFVNNINKTNYLTYCEMNIAYTPEGMIATYLQYYKALHAALEHVSVSEKEVLTPYANFLGGLVSQNKDTLKITKDAHQEYKALETMHTKLNKDISLCFKDGSDNVNRKINEVITRNADWIEVFKYLKDCESIVNRLNISDIKKIVDNSNLYLEAIENNINDAEIDFMQANKQVITHLSEGAFHTAKEVELIGILIYQEQVMRNAVYRTAQNVQLQLITTK